MVGRVPVLSPHHLQHRSEQDNKGSTCVQQTQCLLLAGSKAKQGPAAPPEETGCWVAEAFQATANHLCTHFTHHFKLAAVLQVVDGRHHGLHLARHCHRPTRQDATLCVWSRASAADDDHAKQRAPGRRLTSALTHNQPACPQPTVRSECCWV